MLLTATARTVGMELFSVRLEADDLLLLVPESILQYASVISHTMI
jgi:hypothetical protein